MSISEDDTKMIADLSEQASSLVAAYLQAPNDKLALVKARTAAQNLFLELQDGDDSFMRLGEQSGTACVLRFFVHIGVLEAIPAQGSISADELAQKVDCAPEFLIRMLRLVAAAGYLSEPELGVYAHTKRSIPLTDPAYSAWFQVLMDDFYTKGCWAALPGYYSREEKKSPHDPRRNPYSATFRMDGHTWQEVIARTPENLQRFQLALSSRFTEFAVAGVYPFEDLEAVSNKAEDEGKVFMVDVGGMTGLVLSEVRTTFPQLKGEMIVQDLDQVIASIPSGSLPTGVSPMVHDFWTPQPIKGAKVYYFRRVLHDWPNSECVKILKHTADAMDEDSIVLISELVVPDRAERGQTFVYQLDLAMLMFAGRERTAADWDDVLNPAGLQVTKIWRSEIGHASVVEGRKKSN